MIINQHFGKEQEGTYFDIPFEVPDNVEKIEISYCYNRFNTFTNGDVIGRSENNIIDLGVYAPNDEYLGWSGSDRTEIYISSYGSAQGYADARTVGGTWKIHVGAYKVEDGGVDVQYHLRFTMKSRRLYIGDTHMHTTGSDGVMSMEEIARFAKTSKLDFIFITDHNSYIHNESLPKVEGITVLPGSEWTHYQGHAGMLGVTRPYKKSFQANSRQEALAKLVEAQENGALVVLNHPFCPFCGWKWGMGPDVPFDLVELWNGPMSQMQTDCIAWWQQQLLMGRRIRVVAGSDYHRPELLRSVGMPATGVFAPSREPQDLLEAIQKGSCYLSYKPNGPVIDCVAMGQVVSVDSTLSVEFSNLASDDVIRIIYNDDVQERTCERGTDRYIFTDRLQSAGFIRFEVLRAYLNPHEKIVASVSNAIFVE